MAIFFYYLGQMCLKIHNYPIKKNGKIVTLRYLAVNITEHENKLHALTGKEYHYRQFFLNSPIPYQSLNNEGVILDVNPAWEKNTGYYHEEIVGKYFKSILDDDSQEKFKKNFSLYKEKGEINNVDLKLRKKNGDTIYVHYFGKVEYADDGTFLRSHAVFTDITAQKKAEETLKNRRKDSESLMQPKINFSLSLPMI
ncbi:MAG: PAS domain S-box protein [Bacteroidota bacterium]|nr:PAS domain S-box protein [Bacteroidota bacterium]